MAYGPIHPITAIIATLSRVAVCINPGGVAVLIPIHICAGIIQVHAVKAVGVDVTERVVEDVGISVPGLWIGRIGSPKASRVRRNPPALARTVFPVEKIIEPRNRVLLLPSERRIGRV